MRPFLASSSHVAAPLRGQACGAVAPQPSRHRRITPSSVPLALLLVNPSVVGCASVAAKRYAARKSGPAVAGP